MKKYILTLLFAIGFSAFSFGQTASTRQKERARKHHKPYVAMDSHFEQPGQKDKLLEHNGNAFLFNKHKNNKVIRDNGYASTLYFKQGKKWRKVKNKMFGTYVMK